MTSFVRGHFFATTENGQISKFTKYGHVIYHLICLLKLINKISQKITKKVFPTNYSHLFDLNSEIYTLQHVPACSILNATQKPRMPVINMPQQVPGVAIVRVTL